MNNCCKAFFDANGLQGVLNEPMTFCPYCGRWLTQAEFKRYNAKVGAILRKQEIFTKD